jgi:translation initiation factor 1
MNKNDNPTVYSTESGRMCPECGHPKDKCVCKNRNHVSSGFTSEFIRVRREKQGRAGKEVTVIRNIPGSPETIRNYVSEIKKNCAAGGAIKDGMIIIQGDHVDFVLHYFKEIGFKIKKDGG